MADKVLDAKGLDCPLPILRAKKAISEVSPGGTLEVLATDPGAVPDFEAFCRQTGNQLVERNEFRRRVPFSDQARRLRPGPGSVYGRRLEDLAVKRTPVGRALP